MTTQTKTYQAKRDISILKKELKQLGVQLKEASIDDKPPILEKIDKKFQAIEAKLKLINELKK